MRPTIGRDCVQLKSIETATVELFLEVTSDGSGNFTKKSGKGIYSIAKTGTGIARIYLEDKYPRLMSVSAIIVDATARNFDIHIKAFDSNPSSGRAYIDLYTLSSGTETDLTASDAIFRFVLKNSTAPF